MSKEKIESILQTWIEGEQHLRKYQGDSLAEINDAPMTPEQKSLNRQSNYENLLELVRDL